MKKVTIEAFNGVGDKAVKAGEREVDKPDNINEAIQLHGEEKVFKAFWKSEVIEVQRQIRAGTQVNEAVRIFRTLSPEEQMRVLNNRARGSSL